MFIVEGSANSPKPPGRPSKSFLRGSPAFATHSVVCKVFFAGGPRLHHFVLFTRRNDLLSLPLEIIHSQAIYLIENNPAKRPMIYISLPFKSIKFVAK